MALIFLISGNIAYQKDEGGAAGSVSGRMKDEN
jgi:hypothetical protein